LDPLLEQLKTRSTDADLLVNIGNSYCDAQDYANAIDYYEKALKLRPDDVNGRTDMATAIWYSRRRGWGNQTVRTVAQVSADTRANSVQHGDRPRAE
jgi:tetratricopeptide (TPR) repeat protein